MNLTKFKEYIDNPVALSKSDEAALKELLEEFPYFNAGQVMLAKIYKNEENFRFERQLKLAAMYAGDRAKLFDYLNAPVKQETVAEEPKVEVKPSVVETKVEEPKQEVKPEPPVIEAGEEVKEEKIEITTPKEVVEETPKPLTRFTLAKDEEVTEAEEEAENNEPVSMGTNLHIKPDIEIEEPKAEEKQEEEVIEEEPVAEIKVEEEISNAPEEEVEEVKEEPKTEPVVEHKEEATKTVSFYDWLALKGDREKAQEEKEKEAKAEPEKKVDINSIIGKFLNEQPTISRPKAEFYNATDMAKRSVEDSNDIVSESLAKLYLKQHLYVKAISVYEKLCLLIPEKSETFASQIKKIKEEHNLD